MNLYYKEQNHEARCVTHLDWQGVGRVSEVTINCILYNFIFD